MSLPIRKSDDFIFFTGLRGLDFFLFNSEKIIGCREYFIQHKLENLMLSDFYGFDDASISFLKGLTIKRLFIQSNSIKDFEIIGSLETLFFAATSPVRDVAYYGS